MLTAPKTSRPRLSGIHARERLFAALDRGRKRSAVWICGPPGAGKTTLIASYLEARALPSLWYQIDEGDADVATFFYYFGLAAVQANPRKKSPLPVFAPEYAHGIAAFTRAYFQELYSRLKAPVIVLDNYQEAAGDSALHEVIRTGLEAAPPGVTVLAASRVAPPPAFARLRANGALEIVNWEELRLTDDEALSIARLRNGGEIGADVIARTQGWAAGLVLMLAGNRTDAMQSLEASTPQELFDYFAGEIFAKTDRKTQDFLMETAFLPHITVAMAEDVTAHRDCEAILGYLTQRNYFTTRHAGSESTYQYHPLFREFLMTRAQEDFSVNRLMALRNDCAKLLAAAGALDDAVDLWIEAKNWEAIADLVIAHAPQLLSKGRNKTLETWLAQIPEPIADAHPWSLYWRAIANVPFAAGNSQLWCERAFELFTARNDRAGLLRSWAGITMGILFQPNSDIAQLDRWVAVLDELLADDPGFPSQDIEYPVAEGMLRSLHWRMPWRADYPRWKDRALALARIHPEIASRVHTLYVVAIYELMNGQLAEARVLIESASQLDMRKLPHLSRNFAYSVLAYYQGETGQIDTCLKTVESGLEHSVSSGVTVWNFYLCGQGVFSAIGSDQLDVAEKLLAQMAGYRNVDVPGDGSWYHYLASWLAARRGDLGGARVHAQAAIDLGADWFFFQAMAHGAMSCVLAELADFEGAARHADRMLAIARRIAADRLLYTGLLIRSGIAFAQGDITPAMDALAQALTLGRQRGYAGCVWWRRGNAAKLCAAALEAGIEIGYAREIVRSRKLTPESPDIENWPWPLKIVTFGGFVLFKDDEALTFSRKAPKKPIALLKAIIAFGGQNVPERKLVDALWTDEEGDSAREAFKVSLHRLRKLLDDPEAIAMQEGKVSLDRRRVWIDAWAFEHLLDAAEHAGTERKPATLQRALQLYRGAFLAEETEEPWSVSYRERLRAKFIRHSASLGKHWMDAGDNDQALVFYRQALEADDLAEELYQGAMRCYQQMNRRAEALAVYRRMRQTLSVTLGVQPSPASEALYRKLQSGPPSG